MSALATTPDTIRPELAFDLPAALEAKAPPEARGTRRDAVRLLVSEGAAGRHHHARFGDLPRFLRAGDLLVVNASGTLPAALDARRLDGRSPTKLRVHLSTHLGARTWVVELRRPPGAGGGPVLDARVGEQLSLPGGGWLSLQRPWDGRPPRPCRPEAAREGGDPEERPSTVRLWRAKLRLPLPWTDYLAAHGVPIRYDYVDHPWPLSAYQTVFAEEAGSAEMPSAGRPFSEAVIEGLRAKGVTVAAIVLHTGVASLEAGERPYAERFRVPAETAAAVNATRAAGGRVIAVGTTVVRALESAVDDAGCVKAAAGWTERLIHRGAPPAVVDGLLTGLHEPRATHLAMLEAFAGHDLLGEAYAHALDGGYLWHEFGDVHLVMP